MATATDEYTALQKYISTYRDPKAVDSAENQGKDGSDAQKGKSWWQVRARRRPRLTCRLTDTRVVLAQRLL